MQSTTHYGQNLDDMLFGSGEYENGMLRLEAQELSIRQGITEIAAPQPIREMEIGQRYLCLFYQDLEFPMAVREHQR